MLFLQLTEWGSCTKQLAPVEAFFPLRDALNSNEGPFLPSTPRSAAVAQRLSTYFVRGSTELKKRRAFINACKMMSIRNDENSKAFVKQMQI